jgi:RES domain-containing protein
VERRAYEGMAYRHHAPAYGALSGDGARLHGGRWNPPASFGVVYAASDMATVDAEFRRLIERAGLPPGSLQPRQLSTIRLKLRNVLDLRAADVLQALSLSRAELLGEDLSLSQLVGEVAHELGYEAVIAPSVTGEGDVIAVFPDNRGTESTIEIAGVRPYRAGATD